MNEGAYELLRSREEKMLADLDVEKSFAEKYVLNSLTKEYSGCRKEAKAFRRWHGASIRYLRE